MKFQPISVHTVQQIFILLSNEQGAAEPPSFSYLYLLHISVLVRSQRTEGLVLYCWNVPRYQCYGLVRLCCFRTLDGISIFVLLPLPRFDVEQKELTATLRLSRSLIETCKIKIKVASGGRKQERAIGCRESTPCSACTFRRP